MNPGDIIVQKIVTLFYREMQADTRFVAIIAGYRDIERSRWRASAPVPLNETTIVTIAVQEKDISIVKK